MYIYQHIHILQVLVPLHLGKNLKATRCQIFRYKINYQSGIIQIEQKLNRSNHK